MIDMEPKGPIPYDETQDPDPFWLREEYGGQDPFDKYLPSQKSFITDLVYATRGMETPTLYVVWSALFLLSTIIKREAWVQWYPDKFYCNLYVILVGPAGSKKSTVIDVIGIPILNRLQQHITDPMFKLVKNIRSVKNKITPEALLIDMMPVGENIVVKDANGHPIMLPDGSFATYQPTSEMALILSEMAVSISKRSYAEGIVQFLLDLYSCHDEWTYTTIARGRTKLEKLYTTFIAATTPNGFRDSIPEAASGDGFISRNIVAYQQGYPRIRPVPMEVKHAPDLEEMTRRAAWIAQNTIGEYSFSKGATKAYNKWYYKFKKDLDRAGENASIQSRLDSQVRKTAFLLRAARYDASDNVISEEDFWDAVRLVEGTYQSGVQIINELSMDGYVRNVAVMENYLKKQREATRTVLMRNMKMKAADVTLAVEHLYQQGKINVWHADKAGHRTKRSAPSSKGDEIYEWRYVD
jgi:hypothetical protein